MGGWKDYDIDLGIPGELIEFSSDGSKALFLGVRCARLENEHDTSIIKVVETKTGAVLHTFEYDGALMAAHFSPDNKKIYSSGLKEERAIDLETGLLQVVRSKGDILCFKNRFNAEGEKVVMFTGKQDSSDEKLLNLTGGGHCNEEHFANNEI